MEANAVNKNGKVTQNHSGLNIKKAIQAINETININFAFLGSISLNFVY
jgi:hypothetical protein